MSRQRGIKDIGPDFGISESCLQNWLTQADRDDGVRSGPTTDEYAANRELRRRVRLLEQENEYRAAAYLSRRSCRGNDASMP